MPKVGRKGAFVRSTSPHRPSVTEDLPQGVRGEHALSIVSTRGHGATETSWIDLARFQSTDLIANHISGIRQHVLADSSRGTLKHCRQALVRFQNYVQWYTENFGAAPSRAEEVSHHFCGQIIFWLAASDMGDADRCVSMRWMKRLLSAIGVVPALLPPNPFPDAGPVPNARDTLTNEQARHLVNRAKFEINVVIRRTREAHRLAAKGRDPRLKAGGRHGDWDSPENRAWVMKRLLERRIETFNDLRFKHGMAGVLARLATREAAETVTSDGSVKRLRGWNGHLRWFFPGLSDVPAFAALLMIRTGWNLTTIAALRSRRWLRPYPYRVGTTSEESHVYIVSYKTRGRSQKLSSSPEKKMPSSKRPWSYPYRLLQFVDYWTAALRREINRKLDALAAQRVLTNDERLEFEKLDAIKDHLFIYKTEQAITSLGWDMDRGGHGANALRTFFKRNNLPFTFRDLRDAPILFSYEQSGQNLFVAQVMAQHADRRTTALYLRRKRVVDQMWQNATTIFDRSLSLIRANEFSAETLRSNLAGQGFTPPQISNLLDVGTTTRWGNRCADPEAPPREFDHRDGAMEACRTQDCIDGCPWARWFRESVDHVARQLVNAERVRATLGLESTEASSLDSRIARCRTLLSAWPPEVADLAIATARETAVGDADLFLGGGL